jgi:uncharacterized protein YbbC (DUF1343 family)
MSFTLASKPSDGGPVRAGVERFVSGIQHKGKRVGLVTNHTGALADGTPTWRAFLDAGINLRALFGPEHGFRGEAQDAVHIADETFHGVTTYSLYGETLRPTEAMLRDVDLMVYDIQDVGCRYYTYLQTLGYTLEACAEADIPYVVLDRPNPIGGIEVEGGPIAKEHESFVGAYGLTHRYGMTIGEYARYVHNVFAPRAELTVYPIEGWRREMHETPLPWIIPSPNLATVNASLCYPGTCLIEGTTVSEGRGTTRPFESIGAPWIDGEELRTALAKLKLPGVVFTSIFFTPTLSKHKGVQCAGVTVHPVNRQTFRPLLTGIALIKTIRDLYPKKFDWRKDWHRPEISFFDRLAGGPEMRENLEAGKSLEDMYEAACRGQDQFLNKRADALIYR